MTTFTTSGGTKLRTSSTRRYQIVRITNALGTASIIGRTDSLESATRRCADANSRYQAYTFEVCDTRPNEPRRAA